MTPTIPAAAASKRPLLTVPELCEQLHIGSRKAWQLVYDHEVGVVRIGRAVRIAPESVDAYIALHLEAVDDGR